MLSNKKVSALHTFWHDHSSYVLGFSEVKMHLCHYMQGKESPLSGKALLLRLISLSLIKLCDKEV